MRRLIHDGHILYDFGRVVQRTSLVQPQSRDIAFRSRITGNRVFDIGVPRIVVQEVIAVRHELLVHHLEFSRRFVRLDGIFFLFTAILRCNRRELPVAQFPFRLDTEKPLVVFGITSKLRTGQRQVRSTRFYALQDVIFEFALERFLIDDADFVLGAKPFIDVLDFDRDVRADLTLDHEARVVVQRRGRPQTRLGAALGIVLFAVTLEADIHRALEHELRLVEPEVLHPGRHIHRNRNIEDRARLRSLVTTIVLPDKTVKPQAFATNVVHVRDVVCKFRIMRCPEHRRIRARMRIHALFRHVDFTRCHVDVVREHLTLGRIHEPWTHANTAHRQKTIQRGCRFRHRDVLDSRSPFVRRNFGRLFRSRFRLSHDRSLRRTRRRSLRRRIHGRRRNWRDR